ncbi:MAG TPA: transposase [Ktedonobacteraceae bacterium]|nr:transposase [Ktedonobacteraceae bacterium]
MDQYMVLEVSAGRMLEEGVALLKRLHQPETVEAVSMDMSASFRPAVKQSLPQAQIVMDHFHVMRACHESVPEGAFELPTGCATS